MEVTLKHDIFPKSDILVKNAFFGCRKHVPDPQNTHVALICRFSETCRFHHKIFLSQTPQAFNFKKIFNLQKKGNSKITDDASLFINNLNKIKMIKGEEENIKITTKNDIKEKLKYYFGIGFDVHRLVKNKRLYLGGIKIN